VECCYARQTKFWISDPDKALWEIYVFHDDIDDHGDAAPPRAEPVLLGLTSSPAPRAWEHRLREPITARIPHDDNTLHEIRLEGSVNAAPDARNRSGLLADAWRALRPGSAIYVHGLSGDRASRTTPALPPPAAAVEHVPATADVVAELVQSGFVDVRIEKLSEKACFVVDGCDARVPDRRPQARPSSPDRDASRGVSRSDGAGHRRLRQRLQAGSADGAQRARLADALEGGASTAFVFLQPEEPAVDGCCTDRPVRGTLAPV
jgi:hypothetical protein